MKRRRFIQTLAAAPAIAVPASIDPLAQSPAGAPRAQEEAPKLEFASLDAAAETMPRFFNAQQFAALKKLSEILMPPLNGMPGALDAGAPEFLDFLNLSEDVQIIAESDLACITPPYLFQ